MRETQNSSVFIVWSLAKSPHAAFIALIIFTQLLTNDK